MMQMLKHNTDPINDMTVSKEGTKTAMMRITIVIVNRITLRSSPRPYPDMPARPGEDATWRASRPSSLSAELTIGRVLVPE